MSDVNREKGKTVKACRAPSKSRLDPIKLSRFAWYYEEEDGLMVVSELRSLVGGTYVGTVQTKIPWAKVELSLKRHQIRPLPKRKPARSRS
jgi:hypothetical protein